MNDKLRTAAQQALEVLKRLDEWLKIRSGGTGLMPDELNTITALRAALAEQPAEPVAWQGVYDPTDLYWRKPPQTDVRPLYTAPQPAKPPPLAIWQIAAAVEQCKANVEGEFLVEFARAIEAAHGINVPQARGEQE